MGGEKPPGDGGENELLGSPPRGRGKVLRCAEALLHLGITPAWAGKSCNCRWNLPCCKDHPRVGGEKFPDLILSDVKQGSPPRGRGKAFLAQRPAICSGITPAWAGKRSGRAAVSKTAGDHPRVGGEKVPLSRALCSTSGSPPRGRGKAAITARQVPAARITPAWAGKRLFFVNVAKYMGDHPRVGGEKSSPFSLFMTLWGSPPRGRGKAKAYLEARFALRITPAWAGKRAVPTHTHRAPHGSPPRGRGKVACKALGIGADGITPAWAGKS